jgi:hypothetical protein
MAQQQAKNKFEILLKMLKVIEFGQCMIFTNLQTRYQFSHNRQSIQIKIDLIFFLLQSRKLGCSIIKQWSRSLIDFGKSDSDKTFADTSEATSISV